ncbi:MAG: DUF1501 domain-containing protein, partial [Planctomycetaceae bacterium]|nr:DUF1501 domain-containing protein [Planctomycetaceae bacterium]
MIEPIFSRREMLQATSSGFGMLALSGLMSDPAYAGTVVPQPHFPPKAKHVILCYMSGGASHLDT